jgi:hypothetical protein
VRVLDVFPPSDLRPDDHLSPQDCLHSQAARCRRSLESPLSHITLIINWWGVGWSYRAERKVNA